ncbi:DMT family transporter [Microvirga flavescens]|uniref:DMT family transporter n=1 Tax=Microvirga flavescens TaxID=2249811 RepID=UPI000DDA98F7|nr:DMT family transporter [Microvirga flavescens]
MQFGPIARMAASIALLSFMDAIIKGMHASYPTLQIVFLRFACGSVVATCVLAAMRPGFPSRETVIANATRSVIAVVTAMSFFYALGKLPLAETLVLSFLAPMFIAFLGLVLLRERVDGRIVGALAVGFAGTLIVVFGQTGEANAARSWEGVAAALLSAVTYAFSVVLLRQRAQRDKFIHIVFFQTVGPMILSAPFAFYVWQPLHWPDLGWFLAMGALGVSGHILMASAYAKAPAARLAPLEYTALIWAALVGYGVFSEIPSWATMGGGALIVVATIITSRR